MIQSKTPKSIKFDESNYIEKPLFGQLTGKKRVTPLLTEPQEAVA